MATENIEKETLEDAKKWFQNFDIDTEIKENNGNLSLFLITDDENAFALELSKEEIEYRAELWWNMEASEDGE